MAALDNDHLVVRVVYTGPPLAGKTQSVRALMPLLRGKGSEAQVVSPGEWRGRTGFFDWADYEGGAYEGRSIRCQILSTPGQVALSDRRELLIRSADAVILVVASQAEALERATQCYEEMEPWLAEAGRDVPIQLILQCNKQDLPGAMPAEELVRALAVPCGKDFYATSAHSGKGLRAAFVAGVRRAVERARALVKAGLELDAPDVLTGEALFERMSREVAPYPSSSRASALPAAQTTGAGAPPSRSAEVRERANARPAPSVRTPARSARSGVKPSTAGVRADASRGGASSGATPGAGVADAGARAAVAGTSVARRSRTASAATPRASSGTASRTARPEATPGARALAERSRPRPDAAGNLDERGARAPAVATSSSALAPTPAALAARATAAPAVARLDAEPASTDRGTIAPPRAEPSGEASADERLALSTPPARLKGSLDPAGAAARGWRPGSGPRPAVLPASAYHRWASPPSTPSSGVRPSVTRDVGSDPAAHASPAPAATPRRARPRTPVPVRAAEPRSSHVPGSARPAVMPASAYFAALASRVAFEAAPAAPIDAVARVEPNRAEVAARAATPVLEPRPSDLARASDAGHAPEPTRKSDSSVPPTHVSRGGAPRAAAASTNIAAGSARPAVMPATAYRAALRAQAEPEHPSALASRQPPASGNEAAAAASLQGATGVAARRSEAPRAAPSGRAPSVRAGGGAARGPVERVNPAVPVAARPAVMPAVAYFAERRATGGGASSEPVAEPVPGSAAERAQGAGPEPGAASSRAPRLDHHHHQPPARVSASAGASVSAGASMSAGAARPAVMPAAAYRAGLAEFAVEVSGIPAAAAQDRDARRVAAGRGSTASDDARPAPPPLAVGAPVAASLPSGSRASGAGQAPAAAEPGATSAFDRAHAVEAAPGRELGARPAVMPVSAYLAYLAAGLTAMPPRPSTPAGSNEARHPPGASAPAAAKQRSGDAAGAVDAVSAALAKAEAPAAGSKGAARPASVKPPGRPAVMPASAWRASLSPEPGAVRERRASSADTAGPAATGAPPSGTELDDARDAREPSGSVKPGAPPSLRVLQGGTQQRRLDPSRSPAPRPALTLLPRPAVMPASAWHSSPQTHAHAAVARSVERRDRVARPAVMPASAWRATSERAAGASDAREALDAATSVPIEARGAELAQVPVPALPSQAMVRRLDEVFPPGASSGPGNDVAGVAAGSAAPSHPLELSVGSDEPTESFRIPETPPGLQAFITSRRPSYSDPFTEPPSEATDGWDVAEPPAPATGVEAPPRSASGSESESLAAEHALSSLPAALDGADSAPFSFPGPRLPGQARMPLAVWRRACWRLLETQLTAYASTLQDARGRWIGELAPGWFARTLRSAPDQRTARRAFAEQVLRERRLGAYLSRPRCVVLTQEPEAFWIWQVACRVPTLATVLRPRLAARSSASALAEALLEACLAYLDARARFVAARVPLPLSPHALSQQDGRIVYSGLMPDPGAPFAEPADSGYAALQQALRKMWPDAPFDAQALLAELRGKAGGRLPEQLLEIIRGVISQE